MTGSFQLPSHPVLSAAYANTAGPAAFLDETFDSADRFYVVTAVLVERGEMALLRKQLRSVAGATFWHTTDELRTEHGRSRAAAMLELLTSREICTIAHHRSVVADDEDLEDARRECLRGVAAALSSGADPLPGPVNLMVLEERNPRNRSSLDRKNIAAMRAESLIHRSMQTVMTSPKYEHLLWLPDLVSSAYRASFTRADDSLFSLIEAGVHFVDPLADAEGPGKEATPGGRS